MGDNTGCTDWQPSTEPEVALRVVVMPYRTHDGWAVNPTPGVHVTLNVRRVYHLGDGSKLTDGIPGDRDVWYMHKHLPYWSAEGVWCADPDRAANIDRPEDNRGQ